MDTNTNQSSEKLQYHDSRNLDARINLHLLYSTNNYPWTLWVFDRYLFKDNAKILELGCGNGQNWKANVHRIPKSWDITLSDFSGGMLEDARNNLKETGHCFKFALIDAQDTPFEDNLFDAVIANHMLYHVPDRRRALAEINRVLKKDGRLYATTVGESHLKELSALLKNFDTAISFGNDLTGCFSLESAPAQMAPHFENIRVERYEDSFEIPEAQPLVDYVMSSKGLSNVTEIITGERVREFELYIENLIQQNGMIKITKDSGMIIADKKNSV